MRRLPAAMLAIVLALTNVLACGGSAGTPTSPSLPHSPRLSAGVYFFTVQPLSGFAGCAGAWTSGFASRVGRLVLVEDQGEWLGRGDLGGDVTMRLQESADGSLIGTIRGELFTAFGPDPAAGLRLIFGTPGGAGALMTGIALADLDQAFGNVEGVLTFVDPQQPAPMICRAARWTLNGSLF